MTSLTSATGTISSAGIGSGLDVNNIVTSLMNVEKQPLNRLQRSAVTLQTKLSAFGQIKSIAAALQDAARPLYNADTYALSNANSSDATSVSATTTTKAVPGVYSLLVSSLSAAQSLVTNGAPFASSAEVVGIGSITIQLGAWSAGQTAFTPKDGASAITIPIGAGENTLAGIRDKINAANAGVSATIVTDATGSRLALQSSATGAVNGFRITTVNDDPLGSGTKGLTSLAYDPPAGGVGGMTLAQSAANAQATINGIAVSSSSNTLDNVVDGITFTLSKVLTQPVTVTITRDTNAIKGKLAAFVAAYNTLNTVLSSATNYNPTTKQGALLQGDGTTTGMQNQLRSLLAESSPASSTFQTLSSIGVRVQKDGSLSLDDAAFASAVAKLPELTKALSTVDAVNPSNNGFGKRFAAWTDKLLAGNGSLTGKTTALQSQINANQKDQSALGDRLVLVEQRLRAQYTTLDTTMSKANALAKYITQQFYTKSNTDR